MKKNRLFLIAGVMGLMAFASCKKDYVCTCTTVIGTESTTNTHPISDANHHDAQNTCNNYQDQANTSPIGGTTCHL